MVVSNFSVSGVSGSSLGLLICRSLRPVAGPACHNFGQTGYMRSGVLFEELFQRLGAI